MSSIFLTNSSQSNRNHSKKDGLKITDILDMSQEISGDWLEQSAERKTGGQKKENEKDSTPKKESRLSSEEIYCY